MKTVLELLLAAKALIADKKNWTQGASARNKHNNPCQTESMDAVCFCSLGALARVTPYGSRNAVKLQADAITYLYKALPTPSLASFNDHHTHEEVMEVWDKAIYLAKQDEAGGRLI